MVQKNSEGFSLNNQQGSVFHHETDWGIKLELPRVAYKK